MLAPGGGQAAERPLGCDVDTRVLDPFRESPPLGEQGLVGDLDGRPLVTGSWSKLSRRCRPNVSRISGT